MQYHSFPFQLRGLYEKFRVTVLRESEVRWARRLPNTCIIFVHGFCGRAVSTWGDFPEMAAADARFAGADLFFIGYPSTEAGAVFSAGALLDIIKLLVERPAEVRAEVGGPARPGTFEYQTIVLVGHSLGGALVRDVAMKAKTLPRSWADNLRLVLFAPAHVGANIIELVRTASFGFMKWYKLLEAFAIWQCPVLRDLPEDSRYLKRLWTSAEKIGVHGSTKAHIVIHAIGDKVVLQDSFFEDPPLTPYHNNDHTGCCKPVKGVFDDPVHDVASVLP